jgi:hypothetical protein
LGKLFDIAQAIRPCAEAKEKKAKPSGGHSTRRLAKGRRPPPAAKAHIYPKELFPIAAPTPNPDVVRTLSRTALALDLGPICSIGGFSLICQNLTAGAGPASAIGRTSLSPTHYLENHATQDRDERDTYGYNHNCLVHAPNQILVLSARIALSIAAQSTALPLRKNLFNIAQPILCVLRARLAWKTGPHCVVLRCTCSVVPRTCPPWLRSASVLLYVSLLKRWAGDHVGLDRVSTQSRTGYARVRRREHQKAPISSRQGGLMRKRVERLRRPALK